MNFVQKKRKSDANSKDIVDLQLLRGALMQLPKPENGSNCSGDQTMSTIATATNTVLNNNSSAYVGITSGRGHAQSEVGIAWIDIESPSIKLIQMSDDLWYTGLLNKLNIIQPTQIIVPQTIFDAKPETADGKLIKYLREQFPTFAVIKIPRRNFSDTDGTELINKYCSKKFNHAIQSISSKYYALSAVAGLMKYLQHSIHVSFRENSLKLEFETKYGHLLMDVETTYTLELLKGSNRSRMKNIHLSVYDMLDQCVTSIGKRTLRAKILEPSCDVPHIKLHQQCIAEMNSRQHIELKSLLTSILKQFNYVERLHKLALVVPQDDNIRAAEVLINQTIQLRTCLQLVPVLRIKLESLQSPIVQDIHNGLSDERYQLMLDTIDTVLNKELIILRNDSSTQLTQRVHCIQSGKCKIVDLLRDAYDGLVNELQNYVTNLSARCGQAFKMHYDITHGYHMRLMVAADTTVNDFPDEFNVLALKRNLCILTTSEINRLNIRVKCVIEEITMQSNVVLAFMLSDIVMEIDAIYDLSGFVATLDMLISLATISAREDYVCPIFSDEIRIVDAVHPLLEGNVRNTIAVPNNIIATSDYNFFIITGPNMSGKTVYLKMIAVLQIMAQLGCYVPAKRAELRVADRIFTRIGSNDSIEKNASSFVLEVNMTEHILKNVTTNSLVIIDELYRSTNPKEGLQLAWSFCEHLISKRGKAMSGDFFEESFNAYDGNDGRSAVTRSSSNRSYSKIGDITAPFVYLTTHYRNLTELADWYFNVVNLCFNADDVPDNDGQSHLMYNHRIQEGVTAAESYGLKLAESVRFPPSIVPKAKLIYRDLKTREERENIIIQRNGQRKCSSLANSFAALRINDLNIAQSVVSAAMSGKSSQSRSSRNVARGASISGRSRLSSVKTKISTTTTKTNGGQVADDDNNHTKFQIDKVLYNLYGDISSALRRCEITPKKEMPRSVIESDLSNCSSSTTNTTANANSIQERKSEVILECLKTFMSEQSDDFTNAVIDGLKECGADVITLAPPTPLASQINDNNLNESRMIDNFDVRTQMQSPSTPIASQQLQARQQFSEFALPSSVSSRRLNLSPSQKPSSQHTYRTPSGAYRTPQNSAFEFDVSQRAATNKIWSQAFGSGVSTVQPIMQNTSGHSDRLDFVTPLSGSGTFRPTAMTNTRNTPIECSYRDYSFNISTEINPHLEFDSVGVSRFAGDIGKHSNNSANKYANPFKSIQSDIKLCKSNSKHNRTEAMNTLSMMTQAVSATNERTQVTTPAAVAPAAAQIKLDCQRQRMSNEKRQTQTMQRNEKQNNKKEKFRSQLAEFYQSEKFQRLHRIANSVCGASVSKMAKAPSENAHNGTNEKSMSSSAAAANPNDIKISSVAANTSGATSGVSGGNDGASATSVSRDTNTCVLQPPPGFT